MDHDDAHATARWLSNSWRRWPDTRWPEPSRPTPEASRAVEPARLPEPTDNPNGLVQAVSRSDHLARRAQAADAAGAAEYITALPKAEHDAADWQVAMETMLLVAERDGPEMLARTAVMRALNLKQPEA